MEAKEIVVPEENIIELYLYLSFFSKSMSCFTDERRKFNFHEIIEEIITKSNPENFSLLVAEYPHRSVNNPSNIAYTRDDRGRENDRQVSTSFGKYIRRHFPNLKDHEVRDYAAKVTTDKFEFWDNSDDIIRSVQLGPKSCMQWEHTYTPGFEKYHPDNKHPYLVYDPSLSWKAAVRLRESDGRIEGRALVYEHPKQGKGFVRTYKRCIDYSYSDEFLEVWLKDQGYQHWESWPEGTELRYIPRRDSFLAPYLDGHNQNVEVDNKVLVVTDESNYTCDSTDGFPSESDNTVYCECCDDYHSEDDMESTDDPNYDYVCRWCLDHQFTQAIGYRGRTVLLHEDSVEYCDYNNTSYDREYLEENGITELYTGEYAPVDVCINHGISRENYIREQVEEDSDMIIIDDYCYDMSDVFFCEGSKDYYVLEEVGPIEIEDKLYHPDYAPNQEKEEENV